MKKLFAVIICLYLLLAVSALAAVPEDFRNYALSHGFVPDDGTMTSPDTFPKDITCCALFDTYMTIGVDQVPASIVYLAIYGDVYGIMGLDKGDPTLNISSAAEVRKAFTDAAAALPWDVAIYDEDNDILFSFGTSRFSALASAAQTGSEYDTLADFISAVVEYTQYKN